MIIEENAPARPSRLGRAFAALMGRHPGRPRRKLTAEPAVLRLIAPLAFVMLAAIIACTALACVLARQADDYLEMEHRRALAGAVEALQAVTPDLARVEPALIALLERASGLKQLRFERDPAGHGRDLQSMLDRNGRIVGWFSWEPERPASRMLLRLLPFAAAIAVGLAGFAGLAMWQLRRLGFQLAQSEQHVERLEYQDTLTGLPNHNRLFELFEERLAARPGSDIVAFAALDLDSFDEVNDLLGYAGGDEALVEIGRRLREALPAGCVIGRLGSDEFACVISGAAADETAALRTADALRQAIARPMWMKQLVQVSVSIGIALAPRDGLTRDELTRRADLALRAAKRRGRSALLSYAPDMEEEFHERRFLNRELARALASRSFDVHYQPIVRAEGAAIIGVEALLRWDHPSRGPIPPGTFVPVAEEAGLMPQLGEFVLRRAIADAERWPDLYVSVNVSPVQLRDRAFVGLVSAVLQESGFDPSRLVLEMTESVLVENPDEITARLQELRGLGVRLALDDFGSGYSSLSYLQKLPFDKLKIDRSFVLALESSANGGIIIQAIVALGRALGMAVVIEGVETDAQRVLLRLAGCSEMQGSLFARPAPRESIDELVGKESVVIPGRHVALAEERGRRMG
ncbi:MAG TPA: EAL domain-containing protein [Xanthobacteraceae bacterium]